MLNDVKIPPVNRDQPDLAAQPLNPVSSAQPLKPAPHSVPHPAETIHRDRQDFGTHHPRTFGEKVHINPEYAMPLEDRGSIFSISLTLAAGLIVVAVLVCVYVAIR